MNISDRRHRNFVKLGEAEASSDVYIVLKFHFQTPHGL